MEFLIAVLVMGFALASAAIKHSAKQQKAAQEPVKQPAGRIHLSDALPEKKPPQAHVFSAEGIEFHPPGFHGEAKTAEKPRVSGSMEKKPLEKADLGAERAKQNAHTAANADWAAPEAEAQPVQKQAQGKPMFTPKQLRDAFIMQEILDEPVSRRKGIKRGYGS